MEFGVRVHILGPLEGVLPNEGQKLQELPPHGESAWLAQKGLLGCSSHR
jgi:hypothetical protein